MAREQGAADLAPRDTSAVGEGAVGSARVEVLAIFGPTASGKSAVADAVAATLGTEVVSVDALQVYRGLPILTNQPIVPTHLVAIREPVEQMSVGEFAPLAHAEIDALVEERGSAVVTGGTGLYLRAALADLDLPPAVAAETVARVAVEIVDGDDLVRRDEPVGECGTDETGAARDQHALPRQ